MRLHFYCSDKTIQIFCVDLYIYTAIAVWVMCVVAAFLGRLNKCLSKGLSQPALICCEVFWQLDMG